MNKKINISIIILTFNEEQHIERCINSVKNFAEDIVVVDSFSTDKTVDLAKSLGARVFQRAWINYSDQFQWAIDHTNINTDWIMRLDADEYVEDAAISQLENIDSHPNINGIYIKRKYFFFGKWIKHGGMYPIWVLRIWKRGKGAIEDRWMDEHIILSEGDSIQLDINIVDDNKNSIGWWINKHNSYASREMVDYLNQKIKFLDTHKNIANSDNSQASRKRSGKEKIYNQLPVIFRAFIFFLFRYFFQLGILDGKRGFYFHFMQCLWYRTVVDLKIIEANSWIKHIKDKKLIREELAKKTGLKLT